VPFPGLARARASSGFGDRGSSGSDGRGDQFPAPDLARARDHVHPTPRELVGMFE